MASLERPVQVTLTDSGMGDQRLVFQSIVKRGGNGGYETQQRSFDPARVEVWAPALLSILGADALQDAYRLLNGGCAEDYEPHAKVGAAAPGGTHE